MADNIFGRRRRRLVSGFALLSLPWILSGALRADAPSPAPTLYTDPKAPLEARVEDLFKRLTQPDKFTLMALHQDDGLNIPAIPRLGIPGIRTADAPQGVRDGNATVFPMGVTMASTWDPPLIVQVGAALGQEAVAKNRQVLYGPDLNIHRTPMGGRDFESFGEDPFLTSKMGVAYVTGLQSQGVAACIKHYVCNDQENGRHTVNILVDPRALNEIYLPPFEAAVKQAHAWALMDALNRVNGSWVASSQDLLYDVLRKQWGFDGVIISDWGSIHDTVDAANAGNDVEMPNPQFFSADNLTAALQKGQITQAVIDEKARRVLRLAIRTGLLDNRKAPNTAVVNSPEHQKLALRVAREGITLLKNAHNLLPLDRTKIKSIAVIGPNATPNQLGGRWSADVAPFYNVSVLDGITTKAAGKIKVQYTLGASRAGSDVLTVPSSVLTPPNAKPGEHGLHAEYFANKTLTGPPAASRTDPNVDFVWDSTSPDKTIPTTNFSSRWTGFLTPVTTGHYTLAIDSDDGGRLYLDDKLVIDYWSDHGMGTFQKAEVDLTAGHAYAIRLEQYQGAGGSGMKFAWMPPNGNQDEFHDATAAAAAADVAVVVVGLSNAIEGEELDPPDLNLPGDQDKLIQAVAAANKKTIVVLVNGTPLMMTKWLAQVPGVIESWYAGQEAGNAIADILFGDVTPSGKLVDTLGARREDYPDFGNYPATNDVEKYAEGIYVGYRHFDKRRIAPLFPFGFGLSYTTFAYSGLTVPATIRRGQTIPVRLTVKNTGTRAGDEIVELYVHDMAPKVDRPVRELKGFQRISLRPGEKVLVTIPLEQRALAYYDAASKQWKANSGRYDIEVGSSSRDIRVHSIVQLE